MSKSPYEPWLLNERTAKVLGLPLIALTPTAQLIANNQEWLWFDPAQGHGHLAGARRATRLSHHLAGGGAGAR